MSLSPRASRLAFWISMLILPSLAFSCGGAGSGPGNNESVVIKVDGSSTVFPITEAVAVSGLVRHWSTVVNGRQADKAAFKKDINRLVAGARKQMAQMSGKPAATMTATK